ncbi:MAG: C_GCAxxG_C_C family protein [Clostridia bacterium]|nr:C_GCAxxG_C_C family protein [Clostridia bacterium]
MYYSHSSPTPHETKAAELFLAGYNCAQSTFAAFSDLTGLSVAESVRIASAFGGGMCGRRDTCGSVTGMLLALSCIKGYSDAAARDEKVELYAVGKALADEMENIFGSTVCRELLAGMKLSPTPSVRTEEYYKSRPCVRYVAAAANILDGYLESVGLISKEETK